MPAKSDPRAEPAVTKYYYRRALSWREMLPAIGAGIVVGAAAWYVAAVVTQRTPLVPDVVPRPLRKPLHRPIRRARSG